MPRSRRRGPPPGAENGARQVTPAQEPRPVATANGARQAAPTRPGRPGRRSAALGRSLGSGLRGFGRLIAEFWRRAYTEGVTGLSGMVAYNLLLSIFPLALLALFVAGRVLASGQIEQSVLHDLRHLFPSATSGTLVDALDRIRDASTKLGIFALVSSVWVGASFWGALDTAFCRIYHVPCRGWVQQKRFALAMLVVVFLFMVATVSIPTVQGILVSGTAGLPFGLAHVRGLVFLISLGVSLAVVFAILCIVYRAVPNCRIPWRAIWPGATLATVAIGLVDYAFPFYLSNVSTLAQFGTTFVFVLIVLLWFYALAIIMLAGATVNAMRLDRRRESEPASDDLPVTPSG